MGVTRGDTITRPAGAGAGADEWAAIWQIMRVTAGASDNFTYPADLADNDA